ncbi:MAG: carbon monoxide dehydrogenase subunit G [Alphaproteobacteria bacterium]|nr:carbon monoxide dehydrogenase subunit G [Alphaproteobacteria bacterium]
MDLTGEYRIPADKERVWQALNDPDVLKACIPGCQSLERVSDNELKATVGLRIGPVSASFTGQVTLADLNPPDSYTLRGEGKGGAAGFGRGEAKVELSSENDETVLRYVANAHVGGKLAQIGSRLVDGAARKLADEFFAKFRDEVTKRAPPPAAAAAPAEERRPAAQPGPPPSADAAPPVAPLAPARGVPTWAWVIGLILVALILLLVFSRG